jgi:uncharacterized protein YjeT (DUF2065 family)
MYPMDRPEIKLLAIVFCALVIASRLPGIFWPEKLKAFLSSYGTLHDRVIRTIGGLVTCLAAALLLILFKTIPLASLIVLAGSLALLASGILHFYPATLKTIVAAVERRSALTLRILSIGSVSLAIAAAIYLAVRG